MAKERSQGDHIGPTRDAPFGDNRRDQFGRRHIKSRVAGLGASRRHTHLVNRGDLFSGTFFPLTQMPQAVQVFAWLTPLFHGVELLRGLILGSLDLGAAPWHLAYLLVFFGIGLALADRSLARRLAS